MKQHGYMRKKMNVLSFVLGACVVSMMWLYTATFSIVGQINNEPIYRYQLKQYQKIEKYTDVRAIAESMAKVQAEEQWKTDTNGDEKFEEYLERYKRNADVNIY